MFEWLKNKFNNLTPKDVNAGFMTSNFCSVKLGTKLTLPANLKCLVTYKDKLYLELSEGTHILDDKTLSELCNKQKLNSKAKLKVDLFFINSNTFSTKFCYKDKIPINQQKAKQTFEINYTANITNARKFASTILNFYSSVLAWQSIDFVSEIIEEQIVKFFSHKTLKSASIPFDMLENIKAKCCSALENVGVNLANLQITFKNKTKIETQSQPAKETFNFWGAEPSTTQKPKPELQNTTVLNNTQTEKDISSKTQTEKQTLANVCPACKHKIITGAVFCHICGYEFKTKGDKNEN